MQSNIHTASKEWFKTLFNAYETNLNGRSNSAMAKYRKRAAQKFFDQDFPTIRHEDWKYTSVSKIINEKYKESDVVNSGNTDFDSFDFEGFQSIRIHFINGEIADDTPIPTELPDGLTMMLMADALEHDTYRSLIENAIEEEGGTGANTFLSFNQAFGSSGIFIHVDKNKVIDIPIQLCYLSTDDAEPHMAHPQHIVIAEESAQLTFIEQYQSDAAKTYFNNVYNRVVVGKNAQVSQYKIQREGEAAFQINNTIVTQSRDSRYSHYALDLGGNMVRNNLSTKHEGEHVETNYYGVYLGNGRQHIDNQTYIDHALPNCESNELYKGIVSDNARGVFNGKVMVRQDAQKTNAFQQNSSLVLSKGAIIDAKPQLEIFADDVKCSHGATIGQLDEGSIFYLRSRGIKEEDAKSLLQKAFIEEVIENMPIEAIKNKAISLIESKLGK
jgi:Fe-S cluster assembly protein SufD